MKTAILVLLQLAASGSDAYFTHRNFSAPHHRELNPIARPFVSTTQGQVLFFGAGAALGISVPLALRHHHRKIADTFAILGIADNAWGAAYSATH